MRATGITFTVLHGLLLLAAGSWGVAVAADECERPPIASSASTPDNPVERLEARLDAETARLAHDDRCGYLPARFWARMDVALLETNRSGRFGHLSADDRAAIRGILAATKPGAPAPWAARVRPDGGGGAGPSPGGRPRGWRASPAPAPR